MADHADKLEGDEKEKIDSAIKDLNDVMDDGDLEALESKSKALAEASSGLMERMFKEQAEAAQGDGQTESPAPEADDVVDAEFEEVKDDDAKKAG